MRTRNIVVLGLDERNLATMRRLPGADELAFHQLMTIEELQVGDIPIAELLDEAERRLRAFDGPVDAIVGYWDFPVSTMVPLLCARLGTLGPPLEAVLKCEHKYWSRREQAAAIDEIPPFALVDLSDPVLDPAVGYPCWLKPVKSFSSDLAFEVTSDEEFAHAVSEIRDGVGRVGEPFQYLLDHADLPPEIADAGGQAALAERALTGARAAVEGYCFGDRVEIYGVLDSLIYPEVSSFLRHQYPSQLPAGLRERLADVSRRVIEHIGLENTTFSIEYFVDVESGEINLLEINPRQSQAHAELFEQVDGFANHHYQVRVALGEDPAREHGAGPYAISARWYLRRFSDAVVVRGPSPADIAAVERTFDGVIVQRRGTDGMRLSDLHGQDQYSYELAEIVVGAGSVGELEEKYEKVVAALPFEFEEG
jgi:biotin carboxylase